MALTIDQGRHRSLTVIITGPLAGCVRHYDHATGMVDIRFNRGATTTTPPPERGVPLVITTAGGIEMFADYLDATRGAVCEMDETGALRDRIFEAESA